MNKRLDKLKDYMQNSHLDSIVITSPVNMRYIGSYTGEGYMVITDKANYVITDSRYILQAKEQTEGFEICDVVGFKPSDAFGDLHSAGFENKAISYHMYEFLKDNFSKLIPIGDTITDMRAVKDDEEIALIAKAESIGDAAFSHILDYIKPGVSERDIALEIEFFMRRNGAESLSFDVIVATGEHGSMPHAEPDRRLIQNNSFVTLDFGCVYEGYCSDMTRTVCVGKADKQMKKVYDTVLLAQTSSLDMIRAGVKASEVHLNAQRIIDAEFKGSFGHGLGHGVGLQVHESPNLSFRNTNKLEVNNVVTVEPGIYIDGFGGVRIEDLVVVNEDSYNNLTHSSKKMIEL